MISRESLARFARSETPAASAQSGFDLDGYVAKHGFGVLRRKPWGAHPGGMIWELGGCPFNSDHGHGSAAFTLVEGKPGFRCQHNGCSGKTIKDVFAIYAPDSRIVDASEAAGSGGSRPTQSQMLVELAQAAELGHTAEGEAFASFYIANHREVWPLRNRGFRQWLVRAFYNKFRKPPAVQALQNALGVLEAKALFDSREIEVFTRVATWGENICVDLCNDKWEAVAIGPSGWHILSPSPVFFRRSKGMLALPSPVRGGSLATFRGLINIGDDTNWTLLLCWLMAAFRPRGPYPVLTLQGEQGSAKSTTARFVRRLIDPSSAPLRTPPRDERDFLIAGNNSWVVAFDNLSGIPHWLSDALCRLATGGGFSTRELWTNSDEIIFSLSRPTILNGIDHLPERADLTDRSLILNLPRITETARRDESELEAIYDRECAGILGALFDAVSGTLARFPGTRLDRKPRMADFATWATAAEEPLGLDRGAFLTAYRSSHADAAQEALEAEPVGPAILQFGHEELDEGPWTGTSKDLLAKLEKAVPETTRKLQGWPKSPRGLSGKLRRIAPLLRESGIDLSFLQKRSGGQRLFTISRTTADLTVTTDTTARDQLKTDAIQDVTPGPDVDG